MALPLPASSPIERSRFERIALLFICVVVSLLALELTLRPRMESSLLTSPTPLPYMTPISHHSLCTNVTSPPTVDIVLARFAEVDEQEYVVKWVSDHVPSNTSIRYLVYNKLDSYAYVLPNVGREVHTWFSHCIYYYENLADVTLFVHGSWRNGGKTSKLEHILRELRTTGIHPNVFIDRTEGPINSILGFEFENWISTHAGNLEHSKGQPWSRAHIHPFGEWFKQVIRMDPNDPNHVYSWYGIMAVGKNNIHKHSKEQYEKWRKLAADGGGNGEVMHYFERAMNSIWRPGATTVIPPTTDAPPA